MMNQDQYHASLLNKGQPVGLGWDGITKSSTQKIFPQDPPNNTDVEESIKRVKDDDPKLIELNLNNIKVRIWAEQHYGDDSRHNQLKIIFVFFSFLFLICAQNISDEKFEQLISALPENEHLEVLSLTNVGLNDRTALLLADAIEKTKTLRVLNVETNFISPPVIVTLVKALLKAKSIEEFRATNQVRIDPMRLRLYIYSFVSFPTPPPIPFLQRSSVLGNKIEMEITELVEKNASLLRLGLHLEFNDARHRIANHLQRNIDRSEYNCAFRMRLNL